MTDYYRAVYRADLYTQSRTIADIEGQVLGPRSFFYNINKQNNMRCPTS